MFLTRTIIPAAVLLICSASATGSTLYKCQENRYGGVLYTNQGREEVKEVTECHVNPDAKQRPEFPYACTTENKDGQIGGWAGRADVTGATITCRILSAAPLAPTADKPKKPPAHFTGTAFAVSESQLLTNQHVVANCFRIRVEKPQAIAKVIAVDKERDLALLETTARFHDFATFRSNGPTTGEDLMIAGYPLPGILGQAMSVTKGIVSSVLVSPQARWNFSHTAPTQLGNSGGPIFDAAGNIVGVVVGKLDEIKVAKTTGSLPQNINLGINSKDAIGFLRKAGAEIKVGESKDRMDGVKVASTAAKYTVLVHCFE
jgi:S1-C subfamily serine protease